ncbi:MAG: citrate (Si)-synthase [Prolixibacteraceae bacterium]
MEQITEKVRNRIDNLSSELTQMYENHKELALGEVTIGHLMGGMRGLKAMICNTSYVDPYKGLFICGYQVPEFSHLTPEEVFFLLCTGEFPNASEKAELQDEFAKRSEIPGYIWDMLRSLPRETHPMTMFSLGILAMEEQSVFKKKYEAGIPKSDFWKYTLDDSLSLIAKLPSLAAGIYRIRFLDGELIFPDYTKDMAENMNLMLGINSEDRSFTDLLRLYLVLHCDHEGGNVSAFTARVVHSALSNIYYATSAGLNGLAGPLHGLANQECLHFITLIHSKLGTNPTIDQLRNFVFETLDSGSVVPGYGHAVLRVTDPRFTAFLNFGKQHCSHSLYLDTAEKLFEVVPEILKTYKGGKIADPWPNVDAISGSLLYHYGMNHFDFYTVMFGISRTLGFCAQNIIARGLNQPIIRPKSVTNLWLKDFIERAKK